MSTKIALAVIAGDDCIDEGIMRMLESVKGRIDGVFISYNGEDLAVMEDLGDRINKLYGDFPGEIASVPWTEDFGVARNHSFYLARTNANGPVMIADWIIWLDCDDVLPEDVDLQALVAEAERRHAHQIFLPYVYQSDEYGEFYSHLKERLFRADIDFKWLYPIHENCVGPVGTRRFIASGSKWGSGVVHRRGDAAPKRERNRRIISRWYREDKKDLRAIQMMAHEVFSEVEDALADHPDPDDEMHISVLVLAREALDLYRLFIDTRAPDDDSYVANTQVGRLHRILGEHQNAINIFLQGIKLRPTWPGAYCEIAETYLGIGGHDLAIKWAGVCIDAARPADETFVPIEPLDYLYRPHMIAGAAFMEKGDYEEARKQFTEALLVRPDDFTRSQIRLAVERRDAADREGVQDMVTAMREAKWGWRSDEDKSICFVTRPHLETWDVKTLEEKGLGGSEASVIRLAQQLVLNGWRVVVFGTPEKEGVDDDGIEWYESRRWHPDEPFTATVAVRMAEIFEADINSKVKVLWMHDVNIGDQRLGDLGQDRFSRIDVIVCPSAWHAQHLIKVYNIRQEPGEPKVCDMHAIVNGFDVDAFQTNPFVERRVLNRFVYASSPDRGLERLLHMWPKIQERHPAAALEVFYGWDNIDRLIEIGHPQAGALAYFKAKIIRMIDGLDGITWHGRVNQQTLARYLKTSGVMAYPADFLDTFGIVFHQALVAGCIPIMPDLGALGQMMPRELVVSGAAPNSEIFERLFLDRVDEIMSLSEEDWRRLADEHYEMVQISRWDAVADYWTKLIGGYVERKDNPVHVINAGELTS